MELVALSVVRKIRRLQLPHKDEGKLVVHQATRHAGADLRRNGLGEGFPHSSCQLICCVTQTVSSPNVCVSSVSWYDVWLVVLAKHSCNGGTNFAQRLDKSIVSATRCMPAQSSGLSAGQAERDDGAPRSGVVFDWLRKSMTFTPHVFLELLVFVYLRGRALSNTSGRLPQ